jgi:hypothetical protein
MRRPKLIRDFTIDFDRLTRTRSKQNASAICYKRKSAIVAKPKGACAQLGMRLSSIPMRQKANGQGKSEKLPTGGSLSGNGDVKLTAVWRNFIEQRSRAGIPVLDGQGRSVRPIK